MWSPAILVLLDEALYKELDEATNQILDSSMKEFFLSAAEDYRDYDEEEIDNDDIDNSSRV